MSFYICAAFLAIFGFVGLNSFDPGPSKIEIGLAVVVLAAGLYLHSGAENGRIVGLVVLGGVIAFGAVQLVSGHYVPGTIVAGLAFYRLASAGTATHPSPGYPQRYPGQQPYGQPTAPGQPQQMYYGQQPLGAPAPYGAPVAPPPPGSAPVPQPALGDPRFGPAVPYQPPAPPQPSPAPAYDPYAPPPGS